MTTQIRQQNGISILKPTGKVGGRSVSDLRKVILPQIEASDTPRILINFEQVNRIDSSGLGTLMEAYAAASRKQGRVGVINVGKHIRNLIVLSRVVSLFEHFDSENAAVAGLSGMKKPAFRNLLFVLIAISVAQTFRVNEIASRFPLVVKREKSKQKRFLRFLDTPLRVDALKTAWFVSVVRWFFKGAGDHLYLLVDETDLIAGWKALVVAIGFRHRAIPVFYFIYSDQQIRAGIYKSHNEIIQYFCVYVYQEALGVSKQHQRPVLVFDRGFARARYVIKFLKERDIAFVMRVPRHVGISLDGSLKKLDDLEAGWYRHILYQTHEQIPLQLYIIRDTAFKDPMYLISNRLSGHQIHHCYKRRMQIEHGFRDIRSCFGFGKLVLKKPTQSRLDVLWLCACLAYGLLFISYEKVASTHWQKAHNSNNRKSFSVITIIKRVLTDLWN